MFAKAVLITIGSTNKLLHRIINKYTENDSK